MRSVETFLLPYHSPLDRYSRLRLGSVLHSAVSSPQQLSSLLTIFNGHHYFINIVTDFDNANTNANANTDPSATATDSSFGGSGSGDGGATATNAAGSDSSASASSQHSHSHSHSPSFLESAMWWKGCTPSIHLLFLNTATEQDILLGWLHATRIRHELALLQTYLESQDAAYKQRLETRLQRERSLQSEAAQRVAKATAALRRKVRSAASSVGRSSVPAAAGGDSAAFGGDNSSPANYSLRRFARIVPSLGASLPALPSLPSLPSLSALPSLPSLPSLPAALSFGRKSAPQSTDSVSAAGAGRCGAPTVPSAPTASDTQLLTADEYLTLQQKLDAEYEQMQRQKADDPDYNPMHYFHHQHPSANEAVAQHAATSAYGSTFSFSFSTPPHGTTPASTNADTSTTGAGTSTDTASLLTASFDPAAPMDDPTLNAALHDTTSTSDAHFPYSNITVYADATATARTDMPHPDHSDPANPSAGHPSDEYASPFVDAFAGYGGSGSTAGSAAAAAASTTGTATATATAQSGTAATADSSSHTTTTASSDHSHSSSGAHAPHRLPTYPGLHPHISTMLHSTLAYSTTALRPFLAAAHANQWKTDFLFLESTAAERSRIRLLKSVDRFFANDLNSTAAPPPPPPPPSPSNTSTTSTD